MLFFQDQGVAGDLYRCLPSASGSHINGGDVFLKAIIENNYSYDFTFESPFI